MHQHARRCAVQRSQNLLQTAIGGFEVGKNARALRLRPPYLGSLAKRVNRADVVLRPALGVVVEFGKGAKQAVVAVGQFAQAHQGRCIQCLQHRVGGSQRVLLGVVDAQHVFALPPAEMGHRPLPRRDAEPVAKIDPWQPETTGGQQGGRRVVEHHQAGLYQVHQITPGAADAGERPGIEVAETHQHFGVAYGVGQVGHLAQPQRGLERAYLVGCKDGLGPHQVS